MTGDEFRETLDKLYRLEDADASTHGNQTKAAHFLDMTDRNIRRFIAGEPIPRTLVMLLSMMLKFKIPPSKALKIAKIKEDA